MQDDKAEEITRLDLKNPAAPSGKESESAPDESLEENLYPSPEETEDMLSTRANTDSIEMFKPVMERSLIGEIIDKQFRITELLGKGGMSVVYKANYTALNRTVAIKLMHPHLVSDQNSLLRFKREAQAAGQLDHPNVIKIYNFGVTGGDNPQPYIVMDYVQGESLSELMSREGRLSVPRALNIFAQVCRALSHAHENGIIHRDLKPSNIMLVDKDGSPDFVKLVDFGIAKASGADGEQAGRLTQTGEIFGSPLYMSPEQCMGREVDRRSDVYALGCALYEALNGKPPHLAANVFELFHKHSAEIPEPLNLPGTDKELVHRLDAVVFRALEKDAEKRYQSMSDFEKDLNSIASDLEKGRLGFTLTHLIARRQRSVLRFVNRFSLASYIAALAALLMLSAAVWLYSQSSWFFKSHEFEAQSDQWTKFLPPMFAKVRNVDDSKKQKLLDEASRALMYVRASYSSDSDRMLDAWISKARVCSEIGASVEEVEALTNALDVMNRRAPDRESAADDPNYPPMLEELGDCLFRQGDFQKCIKPLMQSEIIREEKSSAFSDLRVPRTYLEVAYALIKQAQSDNPQELKYPRTELLKIEKNRLYEEALRQLKCGSDVINIKAGGNTRTRMKSDSRLLAIMHSLQGDSNRGLERWDQANKAYADAVEVISSSAYSRARQFENELTLMMAYTTLMSGRYAKSCELYTKAYPYVQIEFKQRAEDRRRILDCYAYASWKAGEFFRALDLRRQAAQLETASSR